MSGQHQPSAGPSSGRGRNQQQQDGPSQTQTAGPGAPRGRRPIQYRGLFQRDLPMMMYGFGDSPQPDPRSIDVMERLTISFLVDLCHRCRPAPYAHPSSSNPARNPYLTRSRVKIDDLRFALRKDDKKLARLEELIYLDGIISGAKKILDTGAIDDVARQVEAEERQKRGGAGDEEEGEDQQQAQGGEGEAREEEQGLQLPGGSSRGRGGGGEEGERGAQRGGGPGRKRKRGAAV